MDDKCGIYLLYGLGLFICIQFIPKTSNKQVLDFTSDLKSKRHIQFETSSVEHVNLKIPKQTFSQRDGFLNSETQLHRKKILQQNCPAYLKANALESVDSHDFKKVASVITKDVGTMRITARYFPRFRAMYCIQHKAGTTNFNRFLNEIKHNNTEKMGLNEVHYGIPFLLGWYRAMGNQAELHKICKKAKMGDDCNDESLFKEIDHYLMVVRHPLTRLHSAWGNKMHTDRLHHYKKHVAIIKEKFTDPNDGKVPENIEVSFQAFLRYVIHTNGTGDWHWDNVNKECHPCLYQPNIVVHTETAQHDSYQYSKFLGYEHLGKMQSGYSETFGESSGSVVRPSSDAMKHFEDIQTYFRQNVDPELVKQIYETAYHWDFKLFGYTIDGFIKQ